MKTFTDQIGVRFYCVRNKAGQYWSNEWGWIELKRFDDDTPVSIFTEAERADFTLPIDDGVYWEIF